MTFFLHLFFFSNWRRNFQACPYCPFKTIQCLSPHLLQEHSGEPGLLRCPLCAFATTNVRGMRKHNAFKHQRK